MEKKNGRKSLWLSQGGLSPINLTNSGFCKKITTI